MEAEGGTWRVELLGGLRILSLQHDRHVLLFSRSESERFQKSLCLFAYLAYYPGLHGRKTMAKHFYESSYSLNNLSVELHKLEAFLVTNRLPARLLVRSTQEIGLLPGVIHTDTDELRECVKMGQVTADLTERTYQFRRVLALYHGQLTGGEWLQNEREEYRAAFCYAVASLLNIYQQTAQQHEIASLMRSAMPHLVTQPDRCQRILAALQASGLTSLASDLYTQWGEVLQQAQAPQDQEPKRPGEDEQIAPTLHTSALINVIPGDDQFGQHLLGIDLPERFRLQPTYSITPSPAMPSSATPQALPVPLQEAMRLRERGQAYTARRILEPLLTAPLSDEGVRLEVLLTYSNILRDLGDMANARVQLETLRALAVRLNNAQYLAWADVRQALICHQTGLPQDAARLANQALERAQEHAWPFIEIAALSVKAYLLDNSGDTRAALGLFQQALDRAERANLVQARITVLSDIARIHGLRGDYSAAMHYLTLSSDLAKQAGMTRFILENRHREALFLRAMGKQEASKQMLEDLANEARAAALQRLESEVLHSLCRPLLEARDFQRAQERLEEAEAIAERLGLVRNLAFIRLDLAFAIAEQGQLQEARAIYARLWQSLLPLTDTSAEIVQRFLLDAARVVSDAHRETMRGLAATFALLWQPLGMYSTVQQLERVRFLGELGDTVRVIVHPNK